MISAFKTIFKEIYPNIYGGELCFNLEVIDKKGGYQTDICLKIHEAIKNEHQNFGKPLFVSPLEIFDDIRILLKDSYQFRDINFENNLIRFMPSFEFMKQKMQEFISEDFTRFYESKNIYLAHVSTFESPLEAIINRFLQNAFCSKQLKIESENTFIENFQDVMHPNCKSEKLSKNFSEFVQYFPKNSPLKHPDLYIIYHSSFLRYFSLLSREDAGIKGWHWGSISPFSSHKIHEDVGSKLLFLIYYFRYKRSGLKVFVSEEEINQINKIGLIESLNEAIDLSLNQGHRGGEESFEYFNILDMMYVEDFFEKFRNRQSYEAAAYALSLLVEKVKKNHSVNNYWQRELLRSFIRKYLTNL